MREIRPLTALRGVFAFWVMTLHIFNTGLAGVVNEPWIVSEGYLTVDFFFFLSGFILASTYGAKFAVATSPRTYLQFVARRWGRLFPLHIAVILAIVLVHPAYPPMRIIEELTLTQRWVIWPPGDPDWINMPSWSISTEWAASLLFPVFVWGALRGSQLRAAFAAILAILLVVYAAAHHGWNLNISRSSLTFLPLTRCFGDFWLGIAAFRFRNAMPWLKSDPVLLLLLLGFVAALILHANDLLLIAIIFPAVIGVAGNAGAASRLLSLRPLHWLGAISYSLYLVHFPIVLSLKYLLPAGSTDTGVALFAIVAIAATLAVSTLTFRFVEVPCRNWVNSLSVGLRRGEHDISAPAQP